MARSAVEVFTDRTRDDAARIEAASAVGRLLANERPLGDAWRAVCAVAMDDSDTSDVRRSAVRALGEAPAAAPNQLVRMFGGDTTRSIRKEALALLIPRSVTHHGRAPR